MAAVVREEEEEVVAEAVVREAGSEEECKEREERREDRALRGRAAAGEEAEKEGGWTEVFVEETVEEAVWQVACLGWEHREAERSVVARRATVARLEEAEAEPSTCT